MFKRLSGIVLLAATCFLGGWMIAEALPFQLNQDVVRATTGATMPTRSRAVGTAIFQGGFAPRSARRKQPVARKIAPQ